MSKNRLFFASSALNLVVTSFLLSVTMLTSENSYSSKADESPQLELAGIVAHRGLPESAKDWTFAPFSDQGAWFGFALPPAHRPDLRGGFSGPFLMSEGRWLASQLLTFDLIDSDTGQQIPLSEARDHNFASFPGILQETMTMDGLSFRQSLWFDRDSAEQSGMALVRLTVKNTTNQTRGVSIGWSGKVFKDGHTLKTSNHGLLILGVNGYAMRLSFGPNSGSPDVNGHNYHVGSTGPTLIEAGETITNSVAIDLSLEGDRQIPKETINRLLANNGESLARNAKRWKAWVEAIDPGTTASESTRIIAVKSLQTLVNNWRGPAGRLSHHGMFPSHNVWYFNGYWAWDTWKQAVGVLSFDAELAKALVRGMFQHQDKRNIL